MNSKSENNKMASDTIKIKKRRYTEEDVKRIVQSSLNNVLFMYLNSEYQRQKLLENAKNNSQKFDMLENQSNVKSSELTSCSAKHEKTKILVDNFDSKCTNYLRFKKNFSQTKKKLTIFNNLLLNKIATSTDNDEKKYLKQRLVANNNELIFKKRIINMINDYDCKRLKRFLVPYEMLGGNPTQAIDSEQNLTPTQSVSSVKSNIEYKISKYADKFSDDMYNPLYRKKLESYIGDLEAGGAENAINITIPSINNIIANKYSLITGIPKFIGYKKTIDTSKCLNSLDDFDDDQTYRMDVFDLPYNCIQNPLTNNVGYNFNKLTYNFKRDTKAISTDTFMQTKLDQPLYNLLSDYCTFELTTAFSEFVYKLNASLAGGKKLDKHDIVIMYKGGNTTRLYIKTLLNTLKTLSPGRNFPLLSTVLSNLTVGDWDYNIAIDFPKLKAKGFTDSELDKLMDQCRQVVIIAIYKIKLVLTELFETSIAEDYVRDLKIKYFGTEYQKKISDYINTFNTSPSKPYDIEYININKIKTINYVINNGTIDYDMDNKSLNVSSIAVTEGKTIKSLPTLPNNDVSIKNVDSLVSFFTDANLNEFIPEYLAPNNLSITYVDKLDFHRFRSYMSFSLYRLKFNNSLLMNLKKNINPTDTALKLKIPIEIVDVSMSSPKDNLYLFKGIFMKNTTPAGPNPTYNKYIDIDYTSNSYNADLTLPSPEYMFYDICAMLFVNQMVVWEDRKYFKRIERISYLSIICELNGGKTIDQLLTDYNSLLAFYNNLSAQNTSLDVVYNIISNPAYPNKVKETVFARGAPNEGRILELTNPFISFYLDKFVANYIEMIIMLKYITIDPTTYAAFPFNDYCTKQFKVSRDIDAGLTITEITELVGFSKLQDPAKIADNYAELKKYENKMIDLFGGIIKVLNEIKSAGINNVAFDFNKITQLF
jgi:hypothetical protein